MEWHAVKSCACYLCIFNKQGWFTPRNPVSAQVFFRVYGTFSLFFRFSVTFLGLFRLSAIYITHPPKRCWVMDYQTAPKRAPSSVPSIFISGSITTYRWNHSFVAHKLLFIVYWKWFHLTWMTNHAWTTHVYWIMCEKCFNPETFMTQRKYHVLCETKFRSSLFNTVAPLNLT